jgi:PAS domain S-box-containing protein
MVVEDEAIVAMDLESQLRDMGYDVCGTFDNAHDAIACAHNEQPDLVLMDIVIRSSMDGIEAAKHISLTMGIPVIFLTAYSDDTTVRRAAQTAPYGYLTKPFQTRELQAAIEVALYKAMLERKLRNSEQWFAATLRCVGDGVIATDENESISFMNPVAESLLGWQLEEVKGKKVGDIFRLEDRHSHQPAESPSRAALERDTVVGVEFGTLLVTRNGTRRPIDDSVAPIRDERDRVLGTVTVFRDAQERIEAEQRLRQSE